ncbi:hypothetical protein VNO80_26107 [Phaseolus coccineus]|uniref:Uncharacterized protein n=1 Tax=Phaseolus coccineus TaxID=3886 RepID=A0AAN9QPB2_PHACN
MRIRHLIETLRATTLDTHAHTCQLAPHLTRSLSLSLTHTSLRRRFSQNTHFLSEVFKLFSLISLFRTLFTRRIM